MATEYLILHYAGEGGEGWVERGRLEASSADTAVRAFLGQATQYRGDQLRLVAVPTRSWNPVSVRRVETVQLKLEATP